VREAIDQDFATATKAGAVPQIVQGSADGMVAKQIAAWFGDRLGDDPVRVVRSVRAKLGIPAADEAGFEAWRDAQRKQAAPISSLTPDASARQDVFQESTHAQAPDQSRPAEAGAVAVGVPARAGRPGGEPPARSGIDTPAGAKSDAEARAHEVSRVREALAGFHGVELHDDGTQLHLAFPDGTRIPWHFADTIEPASYSTKSYLQSAGETLAAAKGSRVIEREGRTIAIPTDEAGWDAMPEADRAAIREEFVVSGQYDRQSQRIVTRRGAGLRIHQEEAFHAMVDKLRSSDPAYNNLLLGWHEIDYAFFISYGV
jgi:hypothetical protein